MIGIGTFTKPFNTAVNQVGNAANQVYKAVVPDKVRNAYDTSIGGDSSVGKLVDNTGRVVQKQVTAVTDATIANARAFIKKPLPYLATVGLSQFLPYSVATSLVTAVRTGNFKPIIIDMGMNYASMGLNTFLGQDKNSPYGKVITGMSIPAFNAFLNGGTRDQVGQAAVTGGVSAYTTTILTTPKDKGGFGLDPKDITPKMLTNATTAATRAILNGRSVGDAIVESAFVTGGSTLVGKAYENLTKNSETLQTVQSKYDEAKQKVKDIWEGKPSLASDHEKMVKAGQAAKDATDHAMLANSFAKKLSQDYADGKTFDTDAVERAQKYSEDLFGSAERRIQEYNSATFHYESEAITSGYADAETGFDKTSLDLRVADTALFESQKEFTDAFQDYDDTVKTVESFTNQEISQLAAENINAEIMQAQEQLTQAEQALGVGPEQYKSQQEFEGETNPPLTATPSLGPEPVAPEATKTPQQIADHAANLKSAQDYSAKMDAQIAQEKADEQAAQVKAAQAYKPTNREIFERDNPEMAMNQRLNYEREQQIQKNAEDKAKADALLSPADILQRDYPEKAREIHLQNLRQQEHNAQVKAAEEAKLVAENREAERQRIVSLANPNYREQERLAAEQAAMFAKYPEMRQAFAREQDQKRFAAERQNLIDVERANLAQARENQKLADAERKQREDQAAKDTAEAKAKEDIRIAKFFEDYQRREFENSPEGIRQAADKQAKAKADLDEQHRAEIRAREQQIKEKADADALAQHNAQVKAAEDAKVGASKIATQAPQTQTPTNTEPKQTGIGAYITRTGTAITADAIAKKIADDKAARAREEALAKQAVLKKQELARQAAAREKAKADYDEKVRIQKEFQERARADAQAKAKADYDDRVKAQAEAKAIADVKAKAEYDEKVRLKAEYDAKVKADADARAAAAAKAKADADARAAAYAKAKADFDAKAKADYDTKTAAYAKAKADYDAKIKLKAEYDEKVRLKAQADAFRKAQADLDARAAQDAGTETPPPSTQPPPSTGIDPTGTLKPVTPVTVPTGGLTPTPKPPTGGLTPTPKPPQGVLPPAPKPATTPPVSNLPTKPPSPIIAQPSGTLTPVAKPTGTLTPVAKPTGTLTPVAKPTGTLTPAIKPTGALTSVVKPSGTLTPV